MNYICQCFSMRLRTFSVMCFPTVLNTQIWDWNSFSLTVFWSQMVFQVTSRIETQISILTEINNAAVLWHNVTGAGHIIRISSKSCFILLIPFKKWNLYNVYIHSTQTDIFQVFISFNFDDYNWKPQIQYLRKVEYYLRPIQRKDF